MASSPHHWLSWCGGLQGGMLWNLKASFKMMCHPHIHIPPPTCVPLVTHLEKQKKVNSHIIYLIKSFNLKNPHDVKTLLIMSLSDVDPRQLQWTILADLLKQSSLIANTMHSQWTLAIMAFPVPINKCKHRGQVLYNRWCHQQSVEEIYATCWGSCAAIHPG